MTPNHLCSTVCAQMGTDYGVMREKLARKSRQAVGSAPPLKEARATCTQQDFRKSQGVSEPVPRDEQPWGASMTQDPGGKEGFLYSIRGGDMGWQRVDVIP